MRSISIKTLFLLAFIFLKVQSQPLSERDFQLGPLAVGKSISDLLPRIGKPTRVSVEAVPQTGGIASINGRDTILAPDSCLIYEFDSLTIQTNGFGYIDNFTCTRHGYKTYRGIQVGDSVNKVLKRYGKAPIDDSEIEYLQDGVAMSIVFNLANKKVTSISMGSYTP